MAISADEVLSRHMTKDQRSKASIRGEQLVKEYHTLRSLRKKRELTQTELAEILGLTQDNISRLEKRPDVLVSTLRKYVEAMGGELDLIIRFPDSEPVKLENAERE